MKRKIARILSMLLAAVLVITSLMMGIAALASAETVTVAASIAPVIDWGTLVTQVAIWIIGALAAVTA
jgi:hypothetical protein